MKPLKTRIWEYIALYGNVSFAELCRNVPGFEGKYVVGLQDEKIIFWNGMSLRAMTAMKELLADGSIRQKPTRSCFDFADAHVLPKLVDNRPYKRPRGGPMLFSSTTPCPLDVQDREIKHILTNGMIR